MILGGSCVLQCFCTERLIWKRQRSNSFRPTSQRYETVAYLPPVEGSTVGIPGMFQDGEKKSAAVTAFAEEVRVGNPACPDALHSLKEHFIHESSPGPVKASHFVFGQTSPNQSEDVRFRRVVLRQDMVDAAAQLLKAATA